MFEIKNCLTINNKKYIRVDFTLVNGKKSDATFVFNLDCTESDVIERSQQMLDELNSQIVIEEDNGDSL